MKTRHPFVRRILQAAVLAGCSSTLTGCMLAARITAIPAQVLTELRQEQRYVETVVRLSETASARFISHCKKETTWDAGRGTWTGWVPVGGYQAAPYQVHRVDGRYLVAVALSGCNRKAGDSMNRPVGVLENPDGQWVVHIPVNGSAADKALYREQLVRDLPSLPTVSPEPTFEPELSRMLNDALSRKAVMEPPRVNVLGTSVARSPEKRLEFASRMQGSSAVTCRGSSCDFLPTTYTRWYESKTLPAERIADRWRVDMDSAFPGRMTLYISPSGKPVHLPVELRSNTYRPELEPTGILGPGRDLSNGLYFTLTPSRPVDRLRLG